MVQTIREKLFLGFLIMAMTPLFIFGITTYLQITGSLEKEMQTETGKNMYQLDHFITAMLNKNKEDSRVLSTNPFVMEGDGQLPVLFDKQGYVPLYYETDTIAGRIFSEFERYGQFHSNVAYVYLGTKDGGYLQWPKVREGKGGFDPRLRPWYVQALLQPELAVVSQPYLAFLGDNVIISTTKAVMDKSGQVIGVVGIDVSLDQLSRIVEEANHNKDNQLFLFTQDGVILAHPDKSMHFQPIDRLELGRDDPRPEREDPYQRLLGKSDDFFETTLQGKAVYVSFQTSSATGWKLATIVDKSALLAKNQQVALNIGFAVVLLIGLTIWAAPFITRVLTRPLAEIVERLQQLKDGNFAGTLSAEILQREDEIGKVAQAVAIMQDGRHQAELQLKQSHQELAGLYEQLAGSEEELRAQFDELLDKQQQIEKSEERYRLATEGANDAIWDWDIETGRMIVSKRWQEKLGWPNSIAGNPVTLWHDSVHPDDALVFDTNLKEHLTGKSSEYLCEYRLRNQSGTYLWVLTRGKALFDETGTAVRMAGSFTDITDHKMQELQIQHMAYYDSLTNLPNRAAIVKQLSAETQNAAAVGSILFVDLDNFKLVNDSFGYEQGDRLLVDVAGKLKEIAGENFVARLGGDEFIILVKGVVDHAAIENLAQRITQVVDRAFGDGHNCFIVTSSVGIASYPQDGSHPDTLMRSADIALHQAKRSGRSCYQWFHRKFEQDLREKLHIEQGLRGAIAHEQLVLHYQPIVDREGRLAGLEALLRWQHPEHGLLFPGAFMPVAEESGLIVKIGQWVMRTACTFGKELLDSGQTVRIAVNVSVKELLQADFVAKTAEILSDTGFPGKFLELEIVETLLIENFTVAAPRLYQLRSMGVKISLDDFGTGYSSLRYLRELPINTIKIDRSFLAGAMKNNKQAAIIEMIIELSHRLELTVIAEGVETEEQHRFLQQKNCDKMQGYLISKPVPQSEIRVSGGGFSDILFHIRNPD